MSVERPEEKKSVVCESNEMYAAFLLRTIKSLGVQCERVSSAEELCDAMANDSFPFVFVSYALFENNKEMILKCGGQSQIVLLTKYGESISTRKWKSLSMPVHAISVANVLNGVSGKFLYHSGGELAASFVAPNAKVLIVDDINTNLKVASGLLKPYKMKVALCNSGPEAIEAVQSKDYDIVFMDHKMPGMDGMEATKHIRALGDEDPYYKNIPIIALTANAVSSMKDAFLENGFDDFLPKPIDTIHLDMILQKWIPREKQAEHSPEGNSELPSQADLEIEGLDIKNGLFRTGGNLKFYCEVLAAFHEDEAKRIKEIRDCLAAGNLPLYTIHVHALKSALAYMGAIKLSGEAHELEMAGERGDLPFITANNVHFLTKLEQLLGNIGSALPLRDANSGNEGKHLDNKQVQAVLAKLKAAIEDMDVGEINQAADILQQAACVDDAKTIIRKISKHILMAEYDEALVLIDSFSFSASVE